MRIDVKGNYNRRRKRYNVTVMHGLPALDRCDNVSSEAHMVKKTKNVKDKGLHTRVVFLATKELALELQNHVTATGVPAGETIRRALVAYLARTTNRVNIT
jgi:hypothetical protein